MGYSISNLNLSYIDGEMRRIIFEDAEASFEEGNLYAIMGRSGSGKSSLLSVLTGLQKADTSEIMFNGEEIVEKNFAQFRRDNVAIIFQNYNLIEYLSPMQNITVALSIRKGSQQNSNDYIGYLLDLVDISEQNIKKKVSKLSGGEKQRVAIARALGVDADIIIADEPTGNLDVENEKKVIELFKKIAREHNKIVVIVTHSAEVAKECDTVIWIKDRKLVANVNV